MDHSVSGQVRRSSFYGQGLDFLAWGLRFSGLTLRVVGIGEPEARAGRGGYGDPRPVQSRSRGGSRRSRRRTRWPPGLRLSRRPFAAHGTEHFPVWFDDGKIEAAL